MFNLRSKAEKGIFDKLEEELQSELDDWLKDVV